MILNDFNFQIDMICVPRVGGGDPKSMNQAWLIGKCSPRRRG